MEMGARSIFTISFLFIVSERHAAFTKLNKKSFRVQAGESAGEWIRERNI
jgi:hypothetical protein